MPVARIMSINKNQIPNRNKTLDKQSVFRIQARTARVVLAVLLCAAFAAAFVIIKYDKKPGKALGVAMPQTVSTEIPGWWYKDYFGASICDKDNCRPESDPDKDKLTNAQEFYYHSDPTMPDTNKNGLNDGEDVAQGFDPSKPGKVTFEEAASDDSIVGESLVFNSDIKKMINDSVDPNKVKLNLISDAEINISQDNSKKAISDYLKASDEVGKKYFPGDISKFVNDAMTSGNEAQIADLKLRLEKTLIDFKALKVPTNLVQLHKYAIAYLQLLPSVVSVPSDSVLADESNAAGNLWYDQTQAFFVAYQKMELESNAIKQKYQ